MNVDDVDPSHTQTLQAIFNRPHCGVCAVIVDDIKGQPTDEWAEVSLA
jgi:hypothetical protein